MKNINTACAAIKAQTGTVTDKIVRTVSQVVNNTTKTVKTFINPDKEDKAMKKVNFVKMFDTAVEKVTEQTILLTVVTADMVTDAAHTVTRGANTVTRKARRFIKKNHSKMVKNDDHVCNVGRRYLVYLNNLEKVEDEFHYNIDKYYGPKTLITDNTPNGAKAIYGKYFNKRDALWHRYLRETYDELCGLTPAERAAIIVEAFDFHYADKVECHNETNIAVTHNIIYKDYNIVVSADVNWHEEMGLRRIDVVGLTEDEYDTLKTLLNNWGTNIDCKW